MVHFYLTLLYQQACPEVFKKNVEICRLFDCIAAKRKDLCAHLLTHKLSKTTCGESKRQKNNHKISKTNN